MSEQDKALQQFKEAVLKLREVFPREATIEVSGSYGPDGEGNAEISHVATVTIETWNRKTANYDVLGKLESF